MDNELSKCRACSLRYETIEPIYDVYKTNVIILGQAPGRKENKEGEPFQYASGKMLFENGLYTLGYGRKDFTILNLVKCFPSKTEAPKKQHINICSYNWLKEQTTIINPQIILVLGGIASEFISGDKIKIIEYSGHCEYNHTYNCWIVYSVHPSWLTPPKKKIFQKALKIFSDKMRSL